MPKNTYKTDKLIFYEKENHLKDYITNMDDCFDNKSEESARLILSRRKVKYLIFDGIEINGENIKLIKWLQTNQKFLPRKIIAVTSDHTYKLALDEFKKLPEHKIIKMQTILENKSIEKAIK
jgi:hypothetical protein